MKDIVLVLSEYEMLVFLLYVSLYTATCILHAVGECTVTRQLKIVSLQHKHRRNRARDALAANL